MAVVHVFEQTIEWPKFSHMHVPQSAEPLHAPSQVAEAPHTCGKLSAGIEESIGIVGALWSSLHPRSADTARTKMLDLTEP